MGKTFDVLDKSQNKTMSSAFDNIDGRKSYDCEYDADRLDRNLVAWFQPQCAETEQFRILKTKLLFPREGTPSRVLLVISAEPDDGKSFVAANLSITMAESIDDHVLLMDCDIRSPNIHQVFGYGELPGLREYLENKAPLSSLFYSTMVKKLKILPGGTPHPCPSDLLSSTRMANLIEEVRSRYNDRYIIMDLPPPRLTPEPTALVKQADGVLIVIRYGKTPRKAVKELVESLGREKILGVVSNGFVKGPGSGFHYCRYGYNRCS